MAPDQRQKLVISGMVVPLLGTLFLLGTAPDLHAAVYKCVDADGSITYAQTPCPDQVTTTVHTAPSSSGEDGPGCEFAQRFALSVARSMKSGNASSDTYMKYGGVDAMSKAAVNIVSYVHSFQHSSDIAVDRIAALAGNKCKARSFGEVSCKSLPSSYTDSFGGCEKANGDNGDNGEAGEVGDTSNDSFAMSLQPATAATPTPNFRNSASAAEQKKLAAAREADQQESCRERHENEIDRINNSMRRGFTSAEGEKYRNQLRALRKAINDC